MFPLNKLFITVFLFFIETCDDFEIFSNRKWMMWKRKKKQKRSEIKCELVKRDKKLKGRKNVAKPRRILVQKRKKIFLLAAFLLVHEKFTILFFRLFSSLKISFHQKCVWAQRKNIIYFQLYRLDALQSKEEKKKVADKWRFPFAHSHPMENWISGEKKKKKNSNFAIFMPYAKFNRQTTSRQRQNSGCTLSFALKRAHKRKQLTTCLQSSLAQECVVAAALNETRSFIFASCTETVANNSNNTDLN